MTPFREAFVLPLLFLTVVLLGGLRLGADVRLVPPPLVSLVLSVILIGSLVRAHVVVPQRLMSQGRTPVENVCGLVLLLTLFGASAQVLSLVTPESGLLHLLVSIFFFVQLLTALAAARDRVSMLRSLAVLLACAFVLRFIALESLYAPGRGFLKRVLTTALEGVTLGALDYVPVGQATGYLAFAVLLFYLIGLVLIGYPSSQQTAALVSIDDHDRVMRVPSTRSSAMLFVIVMAGTMSVGCTSSKASEPTHADSTLTPTAMRERILASARVWHPPATPIRSAHLHDNPSGPGAFQATDTVSCRFVAEDVNGLTPKFNCLLPNGEIVKVKYGSANAEVFAEVAATRLLSALGFPADRMFVVEKVICQGCPPLPYAALKCEDLTGWRGCFFSGFNPNRAVEFEAAVIERPLEGRKIESVDGEGWKWYELDRIDPSVGGATRDEVDALRLLAVILGHWDNKGENQRLACLPGNDLADGACLRAVAMIHDVGSTFGPAKLDLANWRRLPVWSDAQACRVSMKGLPYAGATFPDGQISEEGRTVLLELLEQLSETQVEELFDGARVAKYDAVASETRSARAWAAAFSEKVRQVREAGPCASARHLP